LALTLAQGRVSEVRDRQSTGWADSVLAAGCWRSALRWVQRSLTACS